MDITAAERFVWSNARLLERRRFDHLAGKGDPQLVVDALLPYREADGGFGEALEPDFRGPVSQPTTCLFALAVLDEVDRFDAAIVEPVLDWLLSVTCPDGGLPTVLANGEAYPRAPWWNPAPGTPANLLPTAGIAGLLHARGVDHPWLGPATDFCWAALDQVPRRLAAGEWLLQVTYEVRSGLTFLQHVPDRARATAVAATLGTALLDAGAVAVDVRDDETATPLHMAPTPDALARAWFADEVVEAHLDAVDAAQRDDGGWPVPWEAWSPAAGPEWRGILTVEALRTLRAYGRW
jgi:hypothetical protein